MSKYNFNIDNDDLCISKSTYNSVSQAGMIEIYNNFVDLDLPSGIIWCKYNLGSSILLSKDKNDGYKTIDLGLPSGKVWQTRNVGNPDLHKKYIGDYYQWGQPEIPDIYKSSGYKFVKDRLITKYCTGKYAYESPDGKTQLELEDDPAYVLNPYKNHNINMCTPNYVQFKELIENTHFMPYQHYHDIENLHGLELISNHNNNSIFFPTFGYKSLQHQINDEFNGYYWTSTLHESQYGAKSIEMHMGHGRDKALIYDEYSIDRRLGLLIKPILLK